MRARVGTLALLAGVCVTQVAIGTALRLFPLQMLVGTVARMGAAARVLRVREDRIAWAVEGVGRRMPWISTCLVRALSAALFLGGSIRIGVRRAAGGAIESHAWLERGGRIVVGREGAAAYIPFLVLEPHRGPRNAHE